MPISLNFEVDPLRKKREEEEARRQREAVAPDLFLKLQKEGFTPDEALTTAQGWAKLGTFTPPTKRPTGEIVDNPVVANPEIDQTTGGVTDGFSPVKQGPAREPGWAPISLGTKRVIPDGKGGFTAPSDIQGSNVEVLTPDKLTGVKSAYTTEQMDAITSGDPKRMMTAFPQGVPAEAFNHAIQYKTTKTTHEDTVALREDQQQDKLEKEQRDRLDKVINSRSGGLGREDMKVDAAIHARQLIEGSRNPETGEIELNQIQSPELALALANIVSNSSTSNLETFRAMQPQALSKDIQERIGYIFGKPVSVLPEEWANQLVHMLDRQGTTAENLRDKYLQDFIKTAPSSLSKERRDRLAAVVRGNSYRYTFGVQDQGNTQPKKITSQAEYDALPSGTEYTDSAGNRAKKK